MSLATDIESCGYRKVSKVTKVNTYQTVKKSSFDAGSLQVRDNVGWAVAELIAVSENCTVAEESHILQKWAVLVGGDPVQPSTQRLILTNDGINYKLYNYASQLVTTGTMPGIIGRVPLSNGSMEDSFKNWLRSHGVAAAVSTYVDHLKAISEPMASHTQTGRWPGFYEYLTGVANTIGVYDVKSLKEFDDLYGELKEFFYSEVKNYGSFDHQKYDECFDYSHSSSAGDQRGLLNAYKKYREFLGFLSYENYLAAIRTKPFVLLAGISGTGKSRLVRQLARGCCSSGHDLGKDAQGNADSAKKPGNFEMIPVRPNWHDSTELMGYVTRLTDDNKPKYVIKPFVKFLVKAAIWKDVPFFLCLDEMNLAPVEQYFAEYLSVVETRKVVKDANGKVVDIESDVLVNFDQPEIDVTKTVQELMADWIAVAADGTVSEKIAGAKTVYDAIVADKGVRIPKNFIVMGTVNMDETTCSFSRKVLDRAMTFELNEVDMDKGLEKDDSITYGAIQPPSSAIATYVEGFDFYAANKDVCEKIKTYLNTINAVLDGTPFKFAYRSRNEIMLYCIERMKGGIVELPQALDEATSMKVLSRIEGDEQKLRISKRDAANNVVKDANGHPVMVCLLDVLAETIPAALKAANDGKDPQPACTVCTDKLTYMAGRLDGGFTNFFA